MITAIENTFVTQPTAFFYLNLTLGFIRLTYRLKNQEKVN